MIDAPYSAEAEQSVLGAMMACADPAGAIASTGLAAQAFFDARHRALWAAMTELAAAKLPTDVVSVLDHAETRGTLDSIGGREYVEALALCVPSPSHLAQWAGVVRERAAQRDVARAADQAAAVAGGTGTSAEKLDKIAGIFAGLQRQQLAKAPRSLAEIAIARTQHYQDLEEGRAVAGWPTRIPSLDGWLNGGLRPGAMYILAARPAVGKSSFAAHVGLVMASQGLPVLFLSQEMSAEEVADRAVSSTGRVDYAALLSGRMDREHWARACDALESFNSLPMFVDDQGALTLLDIRAKARTVKGLRVLILDYLQLCASEIRENRNAQVEEISRGLKAMAKELGIAVIALSQLNREVEKRGSKRPMLADLRDSGAIEQDADAVMFLWPVREFESEGRRIVGLAVEKNRQGRCGRVGLDFFGAMQRWGESTATIEEPKSAPRGAKYGSDL